jgi:acyl carrier protein
MVLGATARPPTGKAESDRMEWQTVLGKLQRILVEQFERPEALVTPEASLTGALMLDPLDLADLGAILGREFGVAEQVASLLASPSLGDLARDVSLGKQLGA